MYKCPICNSEMKLEKLDNVDLNNIQNSYEDIEIDKAIVCPLCTVYGYVSKDGVVVEYFEG